MREKNYSGIILIFCFSYVALHLCVAFLSIRIWPLTDYPMFSDPVYPKDNISVVRYFLLLKDGRRQQLNRSFANGYGVGELNITNLLLSNQLPFFKKILSQWLSRQENKTEIAGFVVLKIIATHPINRENKLELITESELIIHVEDLQ